MDDANGDGALPAVPIPGLSTVLTPWLSITPPVWPCPYWEQAETKAVTDALSIDVTGGEQDCEMPVWDAMIGQRVVDVVQPDVLYLGGVARTLRGAWLAAEAGLAGTPHSANHGLVTLAAMHIPRAIPNAGPYPEYSIEGPYSQGWAWRPWRRCGCRCRCSPRRSASLKARPARPAPRRPLAGAGDRSGASRLT